MNNENSKEREFECLLSQFSRFIRIHIQKFDLQRFGIDPDDISQEVIIKIWKLLHSEKDISNYASYIKKIVETSVIDQLRKLRREDSILSLEKQKKVSEYELSYASELTKQKNIKDIVGRAVDSLIESRKKVVKLYLLNMSIEEISSYYNWSYDKTRNLLYRGLGDLKKILRDQDIEYENQ